MLDSIGAALASNPEYLVQVVSLLVLGSVLKYRGPQRRSGNGGLRKVVVFCITGGGLVLPGLALLARAVAPMLKP